MSTTMSKLDKRIFAVIIGIDQYRGEDKLHGAVADADDVNELLVQTFGADPKNIVNLRDRAVETANTGPATRENIVNQIRSLKDNANIQKGDAIVIYFAGHGSRVLSNPKWPEKQVDHGLFIESICPVDIGDKTGDGEQLYGIPDYTLRALLNELSREKGNNITLILDSCHSGGANRNNEQSNSKGYHSRQYMNPPPIPRNCDSAIVKLENRGAAQAPGFQGQNLDSHVAITACSSEQLAGEREFLGSTSGESPHRSGHRGIFTQALTAVLRNNSIAPATFSYSSLIHYISAIFKFQIEKSDQTPQLSGTNKHRLIFRDQVNHGDKSFIPGHKVAGTENVFFLKAGSAHGLKVGSKLQIYNHTSESDNPLGTLLVKEVTPFSSILVLPPDSSFELREVFFANVAFLPLKIYAEPEFRGCVEEILTNLDGLQRSKVQWSEVPKEADVELKISDDQLIFYRCSEMDREVISIIGTRILPTVSIKNYKKISKIFQAIANYHRHLWTQGEDAEKESIEFYEVKYRKERFDHVFDERGVDLISKREGTVEIVADDDKKYAVTIKNPSKTKDVYVYLFIFDSGDFTIEPWYIPDTGGIDLHAEAPLKKGSQLHIGHGPEGRAPYIFVLPEKSEKELSFIKLYISTSPLELNAIQQESPFDSSQDDNRKGKAFEPPLEFCATKVIKVIQTRTPTNNDKFYPDWNLNYFGAKLYEVYNAFFPSSTE